MRYLVMLLIGMTLLTTGMFFPWGDKQVVRQDCASSFVAREVRSSESCIVRQIDALYWADHLTVDLREWRTVDGASQGSPSVERSFNDYRLSGEKEEGNAGLFWGRPVLWFSVGLVVAAAAAVVLTARRQDVVHQAALWGLVAAAAFVALGLVLGLGGMVLHSATWSGVSVSRLAPRPGSILVATGGGLSIFAALQHHGTQMLRLQGVGASPLAPILAWEPVEATEPARRVHWNGGRPTWSAAAAVAALALVLFVPFAHKDITLIDCDEEPGRGFVCAPRHLDVAYGVHGATITTRSLDGIVTQRASYLGPFQDAYGGSSWMAASGVAALAAAGACAGLTAHMLQRSRHPARRTAGATRLTAGLVLVMVLVTAAPIIHQSWNWAGSPAGHLRPGLGAYLASLGFLATGMCMWWVRRGDNSA